MHIGAVTATLRPAAALQGTSLFPARHQTLSLLVRDTAGSAGGRTQAGACSSLPHSRRGSGTAVRGSLSSLRQLTALNVACLGPWP